MKRQYLLWLSFTEGALVLAVELCGTKLLSPVLGSSVYVWSFMLSVTLLALAAGYYTGGMLSGKKNPDRIACYMMVAASISAIVMPYVSDRLFYWFGPMTFLPLLAVESVGVFFLPLFFMGAVSPLLIKVLSDEGRPEASRIFAVSTSGGVVSGFVLAFILIEYAGVKASLVFFTVPAILIAGIPLKKHVVPFFAVYAGLLTLIYFIPEAKQTSYEVLYHRNGILGDIRVVRFAPYDSSISKTPSTWVFVNNISQTMYDPGAEEKFFTYNYRVRSLLKDFPEGSKLLLCGMGGGSIISILQDTRVNVEVCELDERMPYIAKTYFGLIKPVQVTIDDARHYIRTSKGKYDAVILDIFRGEETPNHVLSIEGLTDLKKIIHDTTILIVNSHGYLKGKRGDGNRVIYKTLKSAGFQVTCEFTDEKEEKSNLLFLCRIGGRLSSDKPVDPKQFETAEPILTDEVPRLEKLNRQAALTWRSEAKNQLYMERFYRK